MFYVCVICMVSTKQTLIALTDEHREIWERILSPRIKITKLQKCTLLICSECFQLLDTILKFRSTMDIGVKNLLGRYKALKFIPPLPPNLQILKEPPCDYLPSVISAEPDKWLPVASEEVLQSTAPWEDIESARPLPNKTNINKLPRILSRSQPVKKTSSLVHVPKHNEDYAVLIPVSEKTPDLVCEEDVVYSAEISETTKGEEVIPLPKDAKEEINKAKFSSVSEPSEKKIKLNRQLFEAIRATLQSPSLTKEFDIKYEPESGSESGSKSGLEVGRELSPELGRESKPELESQSKPGLRRASGLKLGHERGPELGRELKSGLGRDSMPELGRESRPESGCKSKLELGRDSKPELGHGSEPDLGRESDIESEPDSESTVSCQSDYEDPEHFPNIIFARAFNEISGKEGPQIIGKGLEREGKPEDVQIHSHIVTNPPSEWPCTLERCQLEGLYDEDDNLYTPTETQQDEQVTRSMRKGNPLSRPKCKLCEKSFAQISTLWKHYEREHVEPSVNCNVCRKECRSETELKFHKIKHQIRSTAEFEEYTSLRHACAECGVRCRGPSSLWQHLLTRRHAAVALWRFQCDICKRKLPDKKRIAGHIEREHLAKEAVKCPMCTATFKSARSLRRHAAAHMVAQAQDNMHTNTLANGQARRRKRTTHTNAVNENTNGFEDTNVLTNSEEVKVIQTKGRRKKPHKMTLKKSKMYNKRQENTQTDINEQDNHTEKQTNGKRIRKTTYKISQIRKYSNRQDTYTDTYINGQKSTLKKTHRNGQTRNTKTIHTNTQEIQINTESHNKITHNTKTIHTNTQEIQTNGQINTSHNKITHNTNGRARKKRRRRPYTTRKRARTRAPSGQEPTVAKTSLFEMLSSFIL